MPDDPRRRGARLAFRRRALAMAFWALVTGSSSVCAELPAVVVGIGDGNTLAVRVDDRVLRVKLADIDAPAIDQRFGARAWESLAQLCDAKPAVIDELEIDRHKDVYAEVECDGVDASAEQVRRGMAWVSPREVTPDSPLIALQIEARLAGRGVWSEARALPAFLRAPDEPGPGR